MATSLKKSRGVAVAVIPGGKPVRVERRGAPARRRAQAPATATRRPARLFASPASAQAKRSRFYNTLSHVLRSPLVGTLGYLDYLFSGYAGPLSEEQLEQLGRARDSAMHLNRTVDALLDIAAFDLRLIPLKRERVNLNQKAGELCRAFEDWVKGEGFSLALHRGQKPLWVRVDPQWVKVLFYEVLSNAVRVSPPQAVIDVRVALKDKAVVLSVQDYGPGLPPAMTDWIFEPLAQLKRQEDPPPGERGGLGLALAERICRAHGGRIWASSARRGGLCVSIQFPAASA